MSYEVTATNVLDDYPERVDQLGAPASVLASLVEMDGSSTDNHQGVIWYTDAYQGLLLTEEV